MMANDAAVRNRPMPIFRSGVTRKEATQQRINDVGEQRNEHQNENRIDRLQLRGQDR